VSDVRGAMSIVVVFESICCYVCACACVRVWGASALREAPTHVVNPVLISPFFLVIIHKQDGTSYRSTVSIEPLGLGQGG
jgi:hypothetical protein